MTVPSTRPRPAPVAAGTARGPVVLQSVRALRETTNPYLSQLVEAVGGEVTVLTFGWRRALLGRWDVLHVHWPELLLRGSDRWRTAARTLCFALLLLRLRVGRRAVVRTLHNVEPHEAAGPLEARLVRALERRTTVWIRLNAAVPVPAASRGPRAEDVVVPHGTYTDWFALHRVPDAVRGRLVLPGLLRAYKGVEELLAAFSALRDEDLSLHVVGRPDTPGMAATLRSAAAQDPRVEVTLGYAPDDVLAHEVGEAELVVLPYRTVQNSGVALLALSLGRPVLQPRNPLTEELAAEIGADWVLLHDGDLTAAALRSALDRCRHRPAGSRPDLSRRTWSAVGAAHVAAYRRAVDLVQGRVR